MDCEFYKEMMNRINEGLPKKKLWPASDSTVTSTSKSDS